MPDNDTHPFAFLAVKSEKPPVLRTPFAASYPDPAKYLPAPGLCEALDAAMLLGMPLLLTGEPGTGKTQAARWLAWRLGAPLLRHDVKSTTAGRDLLYAFDEVARFRDASAAASGGGGRALVDYVCFSALGEAILRTLPRAAAVVPLRAGAAIPQAAFAAPRDGIAIGKEAIEQNDDPRVAQLLPGDPGFAKGGPEHCVVLIDELDKAPRDTPNDLLAEVESLSFELPELGLRIAADPAWRPVVIITSNSERALPEPFLRRCLFFDIPPPDEDAMAKIVFQSIKGVVSRSVDGTYSGKALFNSAWRFYAALRGAPNLRKKPGTAELLGWLDLLRNQAKFGVDEALGSDKASVARIEPTLACLAKAPEDRVLAGNLLKSGSWQAGGDAAN